MSILNCLSCFLYQCSQSIRCFLCVCTEEMGKSGLYFLLCWSGKIAVIGGCREYTGAPYFAAISALKIVSILLLFFYNFWPDSIMNVAHC